MTLEEKVMIPKPVGYNCFACGTANPIGLNLCFFRSGNSVCSEITLGKYHGGWENIAHGGIISTILDEVMSWTILYFKRAFFLTRKMDVKYIKPVLVGTQLIIKGRLMDAGGADNRVKARAEMRDSEGNLLAIGSGEFILIGKEEVSPVLEGSKKEIFTLIEGLPHCDSSKDCNKMPGHGQQ
jgi:acyl-coenzyme A thioesterase PaaI-like protein